MGAHSSLLQEEDSKDFKQSGFSSFCQPSVSSIAGYFSPDSRNTVLLRVYLTIPVTVGKSHKLIEIHSFSVL